MAMDPREREILVLSISLTACLMGALVSCAHHAQAEEPIAGQASVIDGDTIEIHGTRIRLWGIDAPEHDQTCVADGRAYRCGQKAALALSDRVGSHTVMCEARDIDRYGRTWPAAGWVKTISAPGWCLRAGPWPSYAIPGITSSRRNRRRARMSESGAGRSRTRPCTVSACAAAGCPRHPPTARSKGNINGTGERIFHVPGQENYEQTRVNLATGERWFCTTSDAVAAGWRPARR